MRRPGRRWAFEGPKDGSALENPYAPYGLAVRDERSGRYHPQRRRNIQGADCTAELWSRYHNVLVEGHRRLIRAGTCPSTCATCCWSAKRVAQEAALQRRQPRRTRRPSRYGPQLAQDLAVPGHQKTMGTGGAAGPAPTATSTCQQLQECPCDPTCWSSSRSRSWRNTTPTKSWPSIQDGEAK